jgi:cytochrome c oxidase subunit 4
MNAEHGDIKKQTRIYLMVFGALIVGTILTVAAAWLHMPVFAIAVGIALLIAIAKGALVAAYFMHLIAEKRLIYNVLLLAAVFIVAMIGLILWTAADQQTVKDRKGAFGVLPEKKPVAHGAQRSASP